MSKSLGNGIEPEEIFASMGADILRLWVASTDYSGEMAMSKEILNRTADAYRRIRNTARFFISNLSGFDPAKDQVEPEQMLALDRWAVDRAYRLQQELSDHYDNYQFVQVYQKIHHFCVLDMGGFYLDIIKDRQYTTQADSLARRSCQTALYHVLEALVRWIAPILSFTADELWQHLPGERSLSVFEQTWYEGLATLSDSEVMNGAYWAQVQAAKEGVNKVSLLASAAGRGAASGAPGTLWSLY